MRTDNNTLQEIVKLHAEYVKEVQESGIKPLSVEIYKTNSHNFVRWIKGEFTPGGSKSKRKEVNDILIK